MIEFNCSNCGNSIKVQDKAAGRRGACKKCGETVQVPSQASQNESIAINEMTGTLADGEKPKRKQFRTPPWTINSLLAGLGLVALIGISFYFLSGGDSTDSIITKKSEDPLSNKTPTTEVLENIDRVTASKKILEKTREAFFVAMETIHKETSSNQFIQSQNIKEAAETKAMLDIFLSTEYMFVDWSLIATKVKQSENGEIVVVSTLCIFQDKNEDAKGALVANFIPKNQACLEKVKKLNTPCLIQVSGQYHGKRDKSGDDFGLYEMNFDLFDVEE
ncbi:MAG: hypothetical protein K0U86_18905 [Planctomycetes bacterium]|nr:hypothetical protein [Planctomycetota bacterium]MCH9726979.1 hypothetical protein [Planctomycetota bacterium]MCH9775231.1 hypothetical protein [Planctomycetota bacterium]